MFLVDKKKGVLLQPTPCSVLLLPWKLLWSIILLHWPG